MKRTTAIAAVCGALWMAYAFLRHYSCGLVMLTNPLGALTLVAFDSLPSIPILHKSLRVEIWLIYAWLIAMSALQWALVVRAAFWVKALVSRVLTDKARGAEV